MKIVQFEFRKSQSAQLSALQLGIIYCIIRVNGTQSKPFSTGISTAKAHFDSKKQEITNCQQTNQQLRRIETDILRLCNLYPTHTGAQILHAYQQGKESKNLLLLALYEQFFEEYELLNSNEESIRTYRLNEAAMKNYLTSIGRKDLLVSEVNERFLHHFQLFLKTQKANANGTIAKRCRFLKRILGWSITKGLTDTHPLQYVRFQVGKHKEQVILEQAELEAIEAFSTTNPTLKKVIMLFLFQCYTGLADTDVRTFGDSEIQQINGVECILGNRNKTGVSYVLPFLPKAKAIYEANAKDMNLLSQQKYNLYLKDLGEQVGIKKVLTTHVGRRTAGSFFLNSGVKMEVVSRMLGHASIRETERVYAKFTHKTIIEESKFLITR